MSTRDITRKRNFEETTNNLTDEIINQKPRKNIKTTNVNINERKKRRENLEIWSQMKESLEKNPSNNEVFELLTNMSHLNLYDDALLESNCNNDNEPANLERKKTELTSNNKIENNLDFEVQKVYLKEEVVQNKVYFYENKEENLYQLHCVKTISDFNSERNWSSSNEEEDSPHMKNPLQQTFKSIAKKNKKLKKPMCVFSLNI